VALILKKLKSLSLPIFLLVLFIAAIVLLMALDYLNIESTPWFNDHGFFFDYTWKGRLFLLFFLWLFVLEFMNIKRSTEDQTPPRNKIKTILAIVCAAIPLIYIFSFNFLGFSETVLDVGSAIRGEYWLEYAPDPYYSLHVDWILVAEYLMFTLSFLASIIFAYGKTGLKNFSITLGLIAGISLVYMLDTFYPYGLFRPFQMLTIPTAGLAAAFLEMLGYNFSLTYQPGPSNVPKIMLYTPFQDGVAHAIGNVGIGWPCAGVHSLFLYTLIALLLFKRSEISRFRKLIYFIVGAIGTYFFNILRILTYFILLYYDGREVAQTFHDVYGELYSVIWILSYMLIVITIEKFGLIEKTTQKLRTLRNSLPLIGKDASITSEG
jgi:thaumarchaeosortase